MTKILLIILFITISELTCLGQVKNPNIDESKLTAFLDSITPVRIDLCKISTDFSNQLTPENFNDFLVESVMLKPEDKEYLDNEFIYQYVIGDSIISNQCYKPNHAIRFYYNDGETGLIGISFSCNKIKDYNSRYKKSETTIRFLNVLRGLFNKYEL